MLLVSLYPLVQIIIFFYPLSPLLSRSMKNRGRKGGEGMKMKMGRSGELGREKVEGSKTERKKEE